jgi:hypothetical protein
VYNKTLSKKRGVREEEGERGERKGGREEGK